MNVDGEVQRFFYDINTKKLELKLENPGNHATPWNFDMYIREDIFIYVLFNKRDSFPFSIAIMPYIESNIPKIF